MWCPCQKGSGIERTVGDKPLAGRGEQEGETRKQEGVQVLVQAGGLERKVSLWKEPWENGHQSRPRL